MKVGKQRREQMTENRIRYSEDLESSVIWVINRDAQAQRASCPNLSPLQPPATPPTQLGDSACEYELVSLSRQNSSLLLSAASNPSGGRQ